MNTDRIQPNLRLAQAYGLSSTRPVGPGTRADGVKDVAELSGVTPGGATTIGRGARSPKVDGLVAARVSKPATTPTAAQPAHRDALPLYTNPALRNAAATGVSLGQQLGQGLDIRG